MRSLTNKDREIYSRQILAVGLKNQLKIQKTTIAMIGAGGLGNATLPWLTASGIGRILLFDDDLIEKSNLSRQWLYSEKDIGLPKGAILVNQLRTINPSIIVEWIPEKLHPGNLTLLEKAEIWIEGSDNLENKFETNDFALLKKTPLIIGALSKNQSHTMAITTKPKQACYRCLFNAPPKNPPPDCSTEGILSTHVGVIGSIMAMWTIDAILNRLNYSKFQVMEQSKIRSLKIPVNPKCICQKNDS